MIAGVGGCPAQPVTSPAARYYAGGRFTGFFARTDADTTVSDAMGAAWVRFAATGNPNAMGASTWPAFTAANDRYLEFGDMTRTAVGPCRDRCDVMEAWILPPP